MFVFRALKELKKKLKRRRRPVLSLGMLAAVFVAASSAGIGSAAWLKHAVLDKWESVPAAALDAAKPDKPETIRKSGNAARDAVLQTLSRMDGEVELVLHRVYWCGEESRLLGRRPVSEAAGLLKARREWGASFDSSGRLVLEETVEDLSPECRKTAHIGLDADGNLSLFDGPPRKDNVIRTFFQLDVRSLESSLSKEKLRELEGGIRVADKEEYKSVLSAFSSFADRKSTAPRSK